jgi:hypothetical protein
MGEGGRKLVFEAFSSFGVGYIGSDPFFLLSALLAGADSPDAVG